PAYRRFGISCFTPTQPNTNQQHPSTNQAEAVNTAPFTRTQAYVRLITTHSAPSLAQPADIHPRTLIAFPGLPLSIGSRRQSSAALRERRLCGQRCSVSYANTCMVRTLLKITPLHVPIRPEAATVRTSTSGRHSCLPKTSSTA